jgi:predicted acetyltransferase
MIVSPDDPVFLEPLSEAHDTQPFRSGATFLDWYLAHRALQDHRNHLSRTIVAVNDSRADASPNTKRVEGYVTLETGLMPTATFLQPDGTPYFPQHQVSVIYLACLARDMRRRGQGYGDILLMEGLRRSYLVSEQVGVCGVFLYSLEEGESLYRRHGFLPFADDPRRLFLPMATIHSLFTA